MEGNGLPWWPQTQGREDFQPPVSLNHPPFSPLLSLLSRYTTRSSISTGQSFQGAYPKVADLRMLFHKWLCTTYSKSSRCCRLLLADPHFVGDKEKAKQTSHNRVSIISTNALNHTDMDTTADPPTTSPDAMNPPSPSPLNVVPQTLSLPPPAPLLQTLLLPPPVPLPTREDVMDQLINENDPGRASET